MALGDKKPVVMVSDRGAAGGVAALGADGKLTVEQLPEAKAARAALGVGVRGFAPTGEPTTFTLMAGSVYLLASCNNRIRVALLVMTNNTGVDKVVELEPTKNAIITTETGSLDVTISSAGTDYGVPFGITTLYAATSSPVYTGGTV